MRGKNQHGVKVVWLCCILMGSYLLPVSSSATPPDYSCLAYAYTSSEGHKFLIDDNTINYGSNMSIIHNCDSISVYFDDVFQASSSNNFTLILEPGIYNMTLRGENSTFEYSNVQVLPDRLTWIDEWNSYQKAINLDIELIDIASATVQANWGVFWGVIIVWVLSTYVYWNLINNYIQKNFIEEVVQ